MHATHLHRQPAPSVGVAEQLAAESSIPKLSRPQMQIYTDAFITVLQLRFINTHPFHPRPPFTVHRRGPAFPVAPQVEDPVSRTVLPVHLYLSRGRGNGGGAPRSAECRRIKSFFCSPFLRLFECRDRITFRLWEQANHKQDIQDAPSGWTGLTRLDNVGDPKKISAAAGCQVDTVGVLVYRNVDAVILGKQKTLINSFTLCPFSCNLSLSLYTLSFDFYSKYNDNTNMCIAILFK